MQGVCRVCTGFIGRGHEGFADRVSVHCDNLYEVAITAMYKKDTWLVLVTGNW